MIYYCIIQNVYLTSSPHEKFNKGKSLALLWRSAGWMEFSFGTADFDGHDGVRQVVEIGEWLHVESPFCAAGSTSLGIALFCKR